MGMQDDRRTGLWNWLEAASLVHVASKQVVVRCYITCRMKIEVGQLIHYKVEHGDCGKGQDLVERGVGDGE